MSYVDLLAALTPTTAEERIRSIIASGAKWSEYERLSNGDILGAVQPALNGRDRFGVHWIDVVVPADGAKARILG